MSENRRGDFFDSHCRRDRIQWELKTFFNPLTPTVALLLCGYSYKASCARRG